MSHWQHRSFTLAFTKPRKKLSEITWIWNINKFMWSCSVCLVRRRFWCRCCGEVTRTRRECARCALMWHQRAVASNNHMVIRLFNSTVASVHPSVTHSSLSFVHPCSLPPPIFSTHTWARAHMHGVMRKNWEGGNGTPSLPRKNTRNPFPLKTVVWPDDFFQLLFHNVGMCAVRYLSSELTMG